MDSFLAEIFDQTSIDDIVIGKFVVDNVFSYALLFSSSDLIKNTMINWVFKQVFGIYPSKITIGEIMVKTIGSTFNDIYVNLNVRSPGIDLESLNKGFEDYKSLIVTSPFFLKEELWTKLNVRNMTKKPDYDHHLTLFNQFNTKYDYAKDHIIITSRAMHMMNPITQYSCSHHGMLPDLVTVRDVLLNSIFQDKAFINMIGKIVIVLDQEGALGAIKALKSPKPVIISAIPITEAHFVCTNILEYLLLDIFPAVVYTTREYDVAWPKRCSIMRAPHQLQLIMDVFPSDQDLLAEAFFQAGGTPTYVLDHIFKYFTNRMCNKRLICEDKTDNCILIVDSRPNILSVLSVMITHYNVPWNVIVCTAPHAKPFYERHLGPNIRFITHPLVDLDRAFDIGDINRMMKDCTLWTHLKSMGYKHSLIIQDDGMIFRGGIEDFLQYEYVGAPWPEQSFMREAGVMNPVGNGGLSLRNIEAMIRITHYECEEKNALYFNNRMVIPEDVYFAKFAKTPSVDVANRFSFEMVYDGNAIGFHKPWPYIKADLISKYFMQLESMAT
jgi:hypothetical protein